MKKGLNSVHGIIALALAFLALIFGGFITIPLFGELGAFLGPVLVALIALIFILLTKTKFSEVFPLELPSVKKFFGSLIMFFGVMLVSSGFSVVIGRFFDSEARSGVIDSLILSMHPAVAILLIAVIPAVCEEFFCRGFLVKCFSKIKHEWLIILIVGAGFGALHLDAYTFLPTALMGSLWCFIAIRTKSLLIPMILHFFNNALSVVLTYTSAREVASESVDLLSFSLPQSIGMGILYVGMGLFPIIFGYKMLVSKRVFVFKTFVALMVSVAIAFSGFVTFTLFSFRYVSSETEKAVITEKAEEIALEVDGLGNFELYAEIEVTKPVKVTVICGVKTVFDNTVEDYVTIQESFKYEGSGECTIIISPIENGEKSEVNITYVILESVIPQ